jgi:hypothetical protein
MMKPLFYYHCVIVPEGLGYLLQLSRVKTRKRGKNILAVKRSISGNGNAKLFTAVIDLVL